MVWGKTKSVCYGKFPYLNECKINFNLKLVNIKLEDKYGRNLKMTAILKANLVGVWACTSMIQRAGIGSWVRHPIKSGRRVRAKQSVLLTQGTL